MGALFRKLATWWNFGADHFAQSRLAVWGVAVKVDDLEGKCLAGCSNDGTFRGAPAAFHVCCNYLGLLRVDERRFKRAVLWSLSLRLQTSGLVFEVD